MAIYRGSGGAGDATNDITINRITELTQEAEASATAAASSESSAASSASSASTSATNAATSATNAATSATSASTSATTASTAATAAQTAQTAAETAQTAAETAQAAAETAETNAETAESNAATSATNAATSATNAATSETNAATSATSASNSATASANSATASASSATDAQTAQTAAEAARDATLTAYDNFDDRYLGAKASDPSVDNDGDALVAGALYFNTTDEVMKLYTGSAWVAAYVSGADYLAKANNLSDLPSASTARTNLGLGTAATLDVGTSANNVVQLDGTGALPAVDGSNLTNVSSVATLNDLTDVDTTGIADGETIVYNASTTSFEPGQAGSNTTTNGLWEHANTITVNYTIASGNNAIAAGPVDIDSGVTVTIPTGSRWVIV
jgi:chemotaxis protein histidine kinase CheA